MQRPSSAVVASARSARRRMLRRMTPQRAKVYHVEIHGSELPLIRPCRVRTGLGGIGDDRQILVLPALGGRIMVYLPQLSYAQLSCEANIMVYSSAAGFCDLSV